MIEIVCYPSGDRAWADSPEAALVAAKTLCQDDADARAVQGRDRHVVFLVDDKPIRSARERDLWGAA